jgi:hypothetical protein
MTSAPPRILLGHLAAFGDCLYATALTRQIKQDFPGCHLTWAIATPYRPIVEGNPYVDAIWEVPMTRAQAVSEGWRTFRAEALRRKAAGEFDEIFFTQVPPDNLQNFDGTVRASVFHGYPRPVTVPVTPILRLPPADVARVAQFAADHDLARYKHVVLFECAGLSGQSFVNQPFALAAARMLLQERSDCCFIISSSDPAAASDPRIIDGSVLRFRENAELTRYTSLFIGCSSGISWLTTADAAVRLPTIQLLRGATSIYASMVHDAEHFGLPTGHIIEMTECTPEHLAACIRSVMDGPFDQARARFHEQIPVQHQFYFNTFFLPMLKRGQVGKAWTSLGHVLRRYGLRALTDTFKATFAEL